MWWETEQFPLFHSDSAKSRMDVLFIALLVAPLVLGKSPSDPGFLYQVFCYKWDERTDTQRRTLGFSAGSGTAFLSCWSPGLGAEQGFGRWSQGTTGKAKSKKRQVGGGWRPKESSFSNAELGFLFLSLQN